MRELKTEGQTKEYTKIAMSFPLGFEIKYRINKFWGTSFEFKYNFTNTDYIDDVSNVFPKNPNSIFSNRSAEFMAAITGKDRLIWLQDYLNRNGYSNIDAIDIQSVLPYGIPPFDTNIEVRKRGNPKVKDSFILTNFSLIYFIPNKIKCPKIR